MPVKLVYGGHHHHLSIPPPVLSSPYINSTLITSMKMVGIKHGNLQHHTILLRFTKRRSSSTAVSKRLISASLQPLDLTEDNVKQVLEDARLKFPQIFDSSDVGITGEAKLAELDGPFVKISLKGRFWHERSTVLARLANYLKQRIPLIF
ncbi:uncharacterized protein LOC132307535 isoform X2 [Cornus florida]|uniref:uncharacterized protein LOC132307535 isoform X2 n=1 Tax=Cornus florida TaxID=4283 RepID=UPI0028967D2C|nr:uncharacterized protein LOC132307535 isoform X2 [Cornus florida]